MIYNHLSSPQLATSTDFTPWVGFYCQTTLTKHTNPDTANGKYEQQQKKRKKRKKFTPIS